MAPGLRSCLHRIVNDVVKAANGKRLIILSELDMSPSRDHAH